MDGTKIHERRQAKILSREADFCWPDERILCLLTPVRISQPTQIIHATLRGFPQFSQELRDTGLQTGHVRLLPSPFHFINQHILPPAHELRQRQNHQLYHKSSIRLFYCSQN